MHYKKLFISGLIVNSLTACSSSPMELSQPKGEWVDFEQDTFQSNKTQSNIPNKIYPNPRPVYTANNRAYERKENLPNKPSDKDILINSSAKNVTLYKAVRTLVPPSWNVKLSPDVAERFRGTISWTGGDQWVHVLSKSLDAVRLIPVIDEQHKEVLIKFSAPVQTKAVTASHMQSTPTNNAGALHKKIFTESVVLATPVVPKPTQAAKAPIKTQPAIVMPVLKSWTISKGTTLKAGYLSWVQKEKCGDREWFVRWDTDTDYPIDYPLSFRSASFEDATSQLFNLYRTAQAPLYVSGYRNQCLIVISDRK